MCVAGNAIETPRLLLNSATPTFPHGLANAEGAVGRYYMRHMPQDIVYAEFERPVRMYRGIQCGGVIRDDCRDDPSRGFVGGIYYFLNGTHLALLRGGPQPPRLGPRTGRVDRGLRAYCRGVRVRRGPGGPDQPRHRAQDRDRPTSGYRSRWSTSTIIQNELGDAQLRAKNGMLRFTRPPAHAAPMKPFRCPPRTTWAPAA